MIKQPRDVHSSTKMELSSAGEARREEMLESLQDAMAMHHARRQNRKRGLKCVVLLFVLVSSCSWMIWQSTKLTWTNSESTAEINRDEKANERDKTPPKKLDDASSHLAKQSSASLNPPAPKKSLVEKYVVSTQNIETRPMESIDDDEMLELLKQAGVKGWIAEIGDERIVLDNDGNRL